MTLEMHIVRSRQSVLYQILSVKPDSMPGLYNEESDNREVPLLLVNYYYTLTASAFSHFVTA